MLSALVRNTRLSWSAAVAVVLAVTAFAIATGRRYLDASYWAAHSVALHNALESTLASMTEAEGAERGYLLTGDESLLVPYFNARTVLRSRLLALRTLTANDSAQQTRLDEVERLVGEGLDSFDANIDRGHDGPGGVNVARLDRGRDQMARLRGRVVEMAADEERRLDAHQREAELARSRTESALGVGALLTVGIAVSAFARVRRDSRRLAEAADAIAFSEARLRRLTEAAFEGVMVTEGGRIVDGNAALALMFGYEPGELDNLDALELVAPEDRAPLRGCLESDDDRAYEYRGLRKNGERFPVEVRGRALPWGHRAVRVTVVRDVTERKLAEAELLRRAERLRELSIGDELTGLANRRGFLDVARERLAQADQTKQQAALFFIDLNGMKPVNDRLGHEAGDRLLVDAAAILRATFRVSDVLARLGGDEFVVLASDVGPAEIAPLEARLRAAVSAFNERSARPYRVSMSIGASLYDPRRPRPIEGLLAEADATMYARKRARQAATPSSMLPLRVEVTSSFPLADDGSPEPAGSPSLVRLGRLQTPPPASGVMRAVGADTAPDELSPQRVTIGRIALGSASRRPSSGRA
ncbi:MAG: diguanylate cyclase [Polyangiaceae bacterium]|nr:diguanylate cyclase [Polyangiaceae bacterium]